MTMIDASIGRIMPESMDGLNEDELRHAMDLLLSRPTPSTWMVTSGKDGTYSLRLSRHSHQWLAKQLGNVI